MHIAEYGIEKEKKKVEQKAKLKVLLTVFHWFYYLYLVWCSCIIGPNNNLFICIA